MTPSAVVFVHALSITKSLFFSSPGNGELSLMKIAFCHANLDAALLFTGVFLVLIEIACPGTWLLSDFVAML